MRNKCSKCSDEIRGLCCFNQIPIMEFNLVLENVPCPLLDLETKTCKDFSNRKKLAPWCLHGKDIYGHGGLPKGCLYLKGHPEREPNPKVKILDILDTLTPNKQAYLVGLYNHYNNISFMKYVEMVNEARRVKV